MVATSVSIAEFAVSRFTSVWAVKIVNGGMA
jgi:hypothetical protein